MYRWSRARSTNQKKTSVNSVSRDATASAAAVPTCTTAFGSGAGAGLTMPATDSINSLTDVLRAAGRSPPAHWRADSKNGGKVVVSRCAWLMAAGTMMNATLRTSRKNPA